MWDFLVVGAGLTGATVARGLTDAGHRVLVVERRDRVAGNIHDELIDGVRVHTHGPHYFRTNSDRIWAWVNRFADWSPFEAVLASRVHGELVPWPIQRSYIAEHCATDSPGFTGTPANFEQASLSMMPESIYERFVKGYTEKQWGTDPRLLDASLAKRFDVRDGDTRLMLHKHQAIPTNGYTSFIESVLEGIPVELGCTNWRHNKARHVVYTGPIDAYHQHRYGWLKYRGQQRTHQPSIERLPFVQINNPGEGPDIRTIDWSHLPGNPTDRTILTTETPFTPIEPDGYEYPYPDRINAYLYTKYAKLPTPGVTICGRLGLYRYLDMDHAIAHAWHTLRTLVNHDEACSPPRDVHHPGTPGQGSSER